MYSVNKKIDMMIRDLIKYIQDTVKELSDSAGIDAPGVYIHDESEILGSKIDPNHTMTTFSQAFYKDNDESTGTIGQINSVITMKKLSLYEIILSTEMDVDKTKEILHLLIRHEIGHVIDHLRFIGKSDKEWNEYFRYMENELSLLKPMRKNASLESRLRRFIEYNHTGSEETANNIAGITDDDWIDHWCKLTKNEKLRKIKEV